MSVLVKGMNIMTKAHIFLQVSFHFLAFSEIGRGPNLVITKKKDFVDDESPSFLSYLYKQGFLVLAPLKVGKKDMEFILYYYYNIIIQFHHIITVESVHSSVYELVEKKETNPVHFFRDTFPVNF